MLRIRYCARLSEDVPDAVTVGGPWYITHPIGSPAGGTYTEVALTRAVADQDHPPEVLDELVRQLAHDLYGTRYAFTYAPDQYDTAIGRYPMRRRERVVVDWLDLYETDPREDRP